MRTVEYGAVGPLADSVREVLDTGQALVASAPGSRPPESQRQYPHVVARCLPEGRPVADNDEAGRVRRGGAAHRLGARGVGHVGVECSSAKIELHQDSLSEVRAFTGRGARTRRAL